MLKIKDLQVAVDNRLILRGVNLTIKPGELVVIMGPNGSGKSSLAYSLIGHPRYRVKKGKLELDGEDLLTMKPDERARAGLFLAWQNPVAVRGVAIEQVLRAARLSCRNIACKRTGQTEKCETVTEFRQMLRQEAAKLKLENKLLSRAVNVGFSGGEKKKLEILQLAILKPKYAILDETDSGLDIDALKLVAEGVNRTRRENKQMGIMVITHYQRILQYIKVDRVLVMKGGKIVKSGGRELVRRLEKEGYEGIE
jgi:Fe-S cluster assembly ATP-binding protein